MEHKKITIVLRGKSEADIEDAISEATRLIKEGFISGGDSNDDGAYYFEVTEPTKKERL
jgi:hypothetical protein